MPGSILQWTSLSNKIHQSHRHTLLEAASKGDMVLLEAALGGKHGEYDQELVDQALLRAATFGNTDCILEILKHGADIDAEDEDELSALMLAATNGHIETVRQLIAKGADIDWYDTEHQSALHLACWNEFKFVAKMLLKAGISIDMKDKHGETALMFCVIKGHVELLQLLIERANPRMRNIEQQTALHLAAKYDQTRAMKCLLDNKNYDLEVQDHYGKTPLLTALSHRKENSALLLLESGANPHALDSSRQNALHHATRAKFHQVVSRLLELHVDFHQENDDNNTPLAIAVSKSDARSVRSLLQHGAVAKGRAHATVAGRYAFFSLLSVALDQGDLDIARMLLTAGSGAENVCELPIVVSRDEDLVFRLVGAVVGPPRLFDFARNSIRTHIHGNVTADAVQQLPLPPRIQQSLRYAEFDDLNFY